MGKILSNKMNNGEICELLAAIALIIYEKRKYSRFGQIFAYKYNNDDKLFDCLKDGEVQNKISLEQLIELHNKLSKEIVQKLSIKTRSKAYKTANEIANLFNTQVGCLKKSSHKTNLEKTIEDILDELFKYSVKGVGAPPTLFNASHKTEFLIEIVGLSDEKYLIIKDDANNKKRGPSNIFKELYDNNNLNIKSFIFVYKDEDGNELFRIFLENIDKRLPEIMVKMMMNKASKQSKKIKEILDNNEEEINIFKKFLVHIVCGLSVDNFQVYNANEKIKLFSYRIENNELKYEISDCDEKLIDGILDNIQIDRPGRKRYFVSEIVEIDGRRYIRDVMQIRINV